MMQSVVSISALLAARMDDHRVWGRFDHEKPGFSASQLLWLLGIVALLVVAVAIKHAIKRRAARTFTSDSSSKLFRELCAAHGLRRANMVVAFRCGSHRSFPLDPFQPRSSIRSSR